MVIVNNVVSRAELSTLRQRRCWFKTFNDILAWVFRMRCEYFDCCYCQTVVDNRVTRNVGWS